MKFLLLLVIIPLAISDRIVHTNNGPLKGTSVTGKNVEAYLGIPYAEPPVGPLRFAKPVRKSSWEETLNADKLPPACIQSKLSVKDFEFLSVSVAMSEDCLHLNLWVPEAGSDIKPVMVFIHGGGFMAGTGSMYLFNGATLAQQGDVIVATINYRVGTLGFFSGFIEEAAGSMGMHDQVMAIQWIKNNAKHFGGDPDNIVLFGESAGGFSVSLHMLSPLSKNLFRRGILQSGTSFHPMFSTGNEALTMGSQLSAELLGCAENIESLKENPKDVVECMKNAPVEKFSEVDTVIMEKVGFLLPRVGDDFLPESPIDLFRKGEFKDTEMLLGVTRDEGSLLLGLKSIEFFNQLGQEIDANSLNETFARGLLKSITTGDYKITQSYLRRVREESRYTYLNALSDAMGDFLITCSSVFQADHHSLKGNPVYYYLFDYRSPSSTYPKWMGVAHFDEVQYVFGNPMQKEFNEFEKEFSNDIMDMWAAFAKTGNPNIPGGLKWPRYTYEDPKYLVLRERDSLGVRPDNYRCEAWKNFFRATIDDEVIENLKKRCCLMCYNRFPTGFKFNHVC